MTPALDELRYRRIYKHNYRVIYAYTLRRCNDAAEAQDIVAETFLVAWRRFSSAPADDQEMPLWLYAIARRVLSNHRRSRDRRDRLFARLTETYRRFSTDDDDGAASERATAVLRALTELREDEREVVLLAAWEQLTAREIGQVLGCSENAAAIRLHRARKRLTHVYEKENAKSGHSRS